MGQRMYRTGSKNIETIRIAGPQSETKPLACCRVVASGGPPVLSSQLTSEFRKKYPTVSGHERKKLNSVHIDALRVQAHSATTDVTSEHGLHCSDMGDHIYQQGKRRRPRKTRRGLFTSPQYNLNGALGIIERKLSEIRAPLTWALNLPPNQNI